MKLSTTAFYRMHTLCMLGKRVLHFYLSCSPSFTQQSHQLSMITKKANKAFIHIPLWWIDNSWQFIHEIVLGVWIVQAIKLK